MNPDQALCQTKFARHERPRPAPPVSLVIKTTILEVPYLEVLVPHMVTQAGVSFHERLVVVDPRPEFSGKYRSRARGTRRELDGILSRLIARGLVDRVLDVPSKRDEVDAIMTLYFQSEGERVPTHALTGGPIFPTLFGIEAVATEHVVVMDADMFFHAAGVSWVRQGLELLSDPTIWLVMTHGGPPAGKMGTTVSLGPQNAPRAAWDRLQRVFRFKTASTRYFLTDRRRLRGKIPVLWQGPEVWPLERCISAGLKKHGASRVCLALEGSWDLHGFFHGNPFPAWAPRIASLVERGKVPALQRGQYDLRLDRAPSRAAWQALIDKQRKPLSIPRQMPESEAEAEAEPLSLAVVVAIRDRAGARVDNMLASLAWQIPRRAAEVVVVSLGSQPAIDAELESLCCRWGARLIKHGSSTEPWCKPLASNIGIQSTRPEQSFVMTLDGDMILAPNFLEVVSRELRNDPTSLVLCQSTDLPRGCEIPASAELLRGGLATLRAFASLRGRQGCGGIQAATREFFFAIRGYDEDLEWWGAEDGDMVLRAKRAGLRVKWISQHTFMLHQWHPKRHLTIGDETNRKIAAAAWERNHRLVEERQNILRNPRSWGGTP